jgi:hypothetical protein
MGVSANTINAQVVGRGTQVANLYFGQRLRFDTQSAIDVAPGFRGYPSVLRVIKIRREQQPGNNQREALIGGLWNLTILPIIF